MAKKSPSAAKKSKPSKTKTPAKSAKKPVVKALKKLITSAVKKVSKVVNASKGKASKPAKPVATKPAASLKVLKQSEKVKTPAVKPALMTKKGKADVVAVEDEAVVESEVVTDAVPAKAEKVSKAKPIRIEKGNIEDEKAKWAELFKKLGKDKAINYKMSDTFTALSPVQHKVLGWGFILKNDNDRLEVLFETGIRMLISNYKS